MSWSWSSVYIARCCCCGLELLVKHRQAGGTQRAEKDIGMSAGAVLALQIAAGALVAALVVAVIVAAAWGGAGHGGAAVHDGDVERALGAATVTTYERAAGAPPAPEGKAADRCAICLSEYAGGDEPVRVVPACGHFFHAECGVDGWLRARRTCPLCRGGLWPMPRCQPMPPQDGGDAVAVP